CNAVNQGRMPWCVRSGPFAISTFGYERPPEAKPVVPREWQPFLLPKPLAGLVTEVLPDCAAVVDLGARDGVRAGMVVDGGGGWYIPHGPVVAVFEDYSVVKLPPLSESGSGSMAEWFRGPFSLGQKLTSRAFFAP